VTAVTDVAVFGDAVLLLTDGSFSAPTSSVGDRPVFARLLILGDCGRRGVMILPRRGALMIP
jgi:hypothetical protein